MTTIKLTNAPAQKYVFTDQVAKHDRSYYAVVDVDFFINSGTPIDPDSGDDLIYLGITTDDVPCQEYFAEDVIVTTDDTPDQGE